MNGYNRCGGYKAPMMYAMPTMQQPMPVKTEMVNVPEACETFVSHASGPLRIRVFTGIGC